MPAEHHVRNSTWSRKRWVPLVLLLFGGFVFWSIPTSHRSFHGINHFAPPEDVREEQEITDAVTHPVEEQQEQPPQPRVMPICQTAHSERAYDNLHMTDEACDDEFGPDLWHEIRLAQSYYQRQGGITEEDVEEAGKEASVRLKILNGQLYVKHLAWAPASRTHAAMHAVYRALISSPSPMPDLDVSLNLQDVGDPLPARFVLDRRDQDAGKAWLMPDFGLFSWPEPWVGGWRDYRCRVNEVESQFRWSEKTDKLFWRGVPLSPIRRELLEITAHQNWSDVQAIDWGNPSATEGQRIAMQDHCKYKYLAQVEGYAYSGRLKYLLMCSSVVVSHRMEFTQHFHSLFDSDPTSPSQNIVILDEANWEGLAAVMEHLRTDQTRAQIIANNARHAFTKYLSPAAETCYWRRLLRAYAALQQNRVPQSLDGWLDYESYTLAGTMEWGPH